MLNFEALLAEGIVHASPKPLVPLLIVEDDRSLLPIFDWIARDAGAGVAYHWCSNLDQARALLRHNRYQLILADFLLEEGGNGLDLFEINEASPDRAEFVLMSSLDLDKFCRPGGSGPSRLLSKPLDVTELQELIRGLSTDRKEAKP